MRITGFVGLSACSGGGTGYIKTEHLQRIKELQIFWQEIIKEFDISETLQLDLTKKKQEVIKKNLILTEISQPDTSLPKKQTSKDILTEISQPYTSLPKKQTSKDSSLSKTLQPDLQIIKEYEKENLVLAETVVLLSKKTVKIPVENHSETLQSVLPNKKFQYTAFCYDILHALENKSYANLFYKYIERDIKNKIIKHPMDLFTIKLKLKNNQYTSLEEFENDIRLIFCNCYTYNDVESEIYSLGKALECIFNKKWNKNLILQDRQTRELKRVRDDNTEDTDRSWKKQIQTLEQNKNNLTYRQVVNDALLIASAYENLVIGNIIPFIEILKTFLLTRSKMSLSLANESMLQAIVESLLPLKYRVPELSLVMDGKKSKGSGRFGYSDIFVLKGIGDNYISLELKYISLIGLIKNQKVGFGANELENLDKILEKENEEILLKRSYTYWSKELKKTNQTTIGEILNNGISQLKSYMNTISKGKVANYSSSGVFDERIEIINSNPNKLKGFVILVIGFRRILCKPIEEVISNYNYNKI
ncbi:Bdf1p [Rhizophagus irregularis DAOM 197198w]|uniref:Bdf1p n=1 Tax=Rhizophagus irregularis (strain DAOM 197198w) TaxID=1432141 RepID=A0A015JB37_RHIIW|nr:Bdf1p [Rhizophagus irregularis DAOM 197198w]